MNASLKKLVAGTMAALIVVFAAAAPASAGPWPHPHWGWGPFAAAGIVGLAAGAAIASENDGCVRYQPVFDRWGHYIGQRPVNVCY